MLEVYDIVLDEVVILDVVEVEFELPGHLLLGLCDGQICEVGDTVENLGVQTVGFYGYLVGVI